MLLPSGRYRYLSLLPALLLTFACGCWNNMGPKMPPAMGAPAITEYKADEFKKDVKNYRAMVTGKDQDTGQDRTAGKDLPGALALRNQMAYRVMVDIEADYSKFEMNLTTERAGFETGADTVQLGMSAAASLVGATDIKNILTASLTGFQGARLSVDKNFFREKTTESIISQMRASRKNKQAELIRNLNDPKRDVTSYPWDAVWIDLVDFYYAGTVPSALVEIASGTGQKAEKATEDLKEATAELLSTSPDQAKMSRANRVAIFQLRKAPRDEATAAKTTKTLQQILTEDGITPKPDGTIDQLCDQFQTAIDESLTDNDKLLKLNKAVTAAMPK